MQYDIESFDGGISQWENKGIKGSGKYRKNNDIHKDVDSLSCQQGLKNDLSTGIMAGLALFCVTGSDGYAYVATRAGEIYTRDINGNYTKVYESIDGSIKGMVEWYNSAGDTFIYFRTNTKLHRKRILGTGYSNPGWGDVNATVNGQTYPKSNLKSSDWSVLEVINGVLLGGNGDTLLMVGYDDSFTDNALQLVPGNTVKCLMEQSKYAVIGCTRKDNRESSSVFFWDTLSQNYNDLKTIPSPSINALVDAEFPMMQVSSEGNVFFVDTQTKLPLFKFPKGGKVNPGGVDVDDGLALFGVYGNGTGYTGIYSYGRKDKNGKVVLNLDYQFDCDEIGFVKKVGSLILFSYKIGEASGVKAVDTLNKAVAIYDSLDLYAPSDLRKEPTWTKVRLVTAPLPAGCKIEVFRRLNKDENGINEGWIQANMEGVDGNATEFTTTGGQEVWFLLGDDAKICETRIKLTPNGNLTPEVFKEEVHFE